MNKYICNNNFEYNTVSYFSNSCLILCGKSEHIENIGIKVYIIYVAEL